MKKTERYFIFSMLSGIAGIMVAGAGSWLMVAGYIVYISLMLGLMYMEGRGWFDGKDFRKIQS